jgi:hypothetical protein
MFATKLFITVTQKKAVRAIERAYCKYRNRKKIKPFTLTQTYNEEAVIRIQQFYRRRLARRFAHGRKLMKRKQTHHRIVEQWWHARYRPLIGVESQMLHNYVQYSENRLMIEEYVYLLQDKYT